MNSKKYITERDNLPKWKNPISHAVVVNNMCFISGQLALNKVGELVSGSAFEEAKLAFLNFFSVLKQSGFERSDVVFIDIAFNDLEDLSIINQLFEDLFPMGKRPARTIYQAQALPYGGKIKVTGTAIKDL